MKPPRRKFLHLAVGALALPAVSRVAKAQAYPTRAITMIVPFAPGGATDVIARLVAKPMGELLGQSIIIENVGGADGSTGTGRAARCAGRRLHDHYRTKGIADIEQRILFASV